MRRARPRAQEQGEQGEDGRHLFDLVEDIARIDNIFTVKQHSILDGDGVFRAPPEEGFTVNMARSGRQEEPSEEDRDP
jgi:hypothetical protein